MTVGIIMFIWRWLVATKHSYNILDHSGPCANEDSIFGWLGPENGRLGFFCRLTGPAQFIPLDIDLIPRFCYHSYIYDYVVIYQDYLQALTHNGVGAYVYGFLVVCVSADTPVRWLGEAVHKHRKDGKPMPAFEEEL